MVEHAQLQKNVDPSKSWWRVQGEGEDTKWITSDAQKCSWKGSCKVVMISSCSLTYLWE